MKLSTIIGAASIGIVTGLIVARWPQPDVYHEMQLDHTRHACGTLLPGTGLTAMNDREPGMQRGWLVSMIPGMTQLRVVGGGTAEIGTGTSKAFAELESGHMVLVTLRKTTPQSVLEWKPFGARNWEKVDTSFLYPGNNTDAQKATDYAIAHGTYIPGTYQTAEDMKNGIPEDPKAVFHMHQRKSLEAWNKLKPARSNDDL